MKRAILALALFPTLIYANSDFDKFIDDGELTSTYRIDYIYLVSDKYGVGTDESGWSNYDQTSWAHSFKVAYKSGYYSDHFGFDLDLYALDPIGTQGEGFSTREYIKSEDGRPVGFTKATQAALKQKVMIDDFQVELFEGRRSLMEYGGTSTEMNAATSSYDGITSEISNDDWFIKLGYLWDYSDSDETIGADFKTEDGNDVDYIATADFSYKYGNSTYRYYITESQDYLRKQQFRYSYNLGPDSYTGPSKVTATLIHEQALSNYKSMDSSDRMIDDYAMLYGLDMEFYLEKGFAKVAYYYTHAPREGSLGQYEIHMSSSTTGDVQGSQDIMTSGNAVDYHNDGEHMISIMAYFDVLPTVTLGVDFRGGWFRYAGVEQQENEISVVTVWKPEIIKNLSFTFVLSRDNNIKVGFDNTPLIVNGKTVDSHGECVVTGLKYTF